MSDLIDRQAAIAAVIEAMVDSVEIMHATEALEDLPSAQTERKRGRWVIHSDEAGYVVNCSECGNGYAGRRKWNPAAEEFERPSLSQYCPNCGAYMENAE